MAGQAPRDDAVSIGFVTIVNWERFQHYRDRNPPWIKLHTSVLENYEFQRLPDADQLLLVKLWLLAARTDNRIPFDLPWIQQRLGLRAPPDLSRLAASGFIRLPERSASTPLAVTGASETEERRGEAEDIKQTLLGAAFAPPPAVEKPRKPSPKPRAPLGAEQQEANIDTAKAFRYAYHDRYQAEYPESAKFRRMVSEFVKRVGMENAPALAAFYVRLEEPLYVRAGHQFDLCLRDAEKVAMRFTTRERTRAESDRTRRSWLDSEEGVLEQGKRIGLQRKDGEEMYDYTQRVIVASRERAREGRA